MIHRLLHLILSKGPALPAPPPPGSFGPEWKALKERHDRAPLHGWRRAQLNAELRRATTDLLRAAR